MDFTLQRYQQILDAFQAGGYAFLTFSDFIRGGSSQRVVVLRHDVDRRPSYALRLARIEKEREVRSTYFFRIVKNVFLPEVISEIGQMGHEIGYHYEDLASAKGNFERALVLFNQHLARMRTLVPVSAICMHGSPRSRFDNRALWKRYDYKAYGIIGEPYLDVDYSRVLYFTDTGRRWNDDRANIRDRIVGRKTGPIKNSRVILDWLGEGKMPPQIMFNVHPDRWHGNLFAWTGDLILQSAKNFVKTCLLKLSGGSYRQPK